ncbi:MAG: NAD(P)H-quinone oxidoreductase [Aeromicrobium erythreum]
MKAVCIEGAGDAGRLVLADVPSPRPQAGEVLLDVVAAGVNRADTSQRRGRYGPPPDASPYPGLECSGTVAALGPGVEGWRVGDRVCALLAGGGYAEQVCVPAGQLMAAPSAIDLVSAAALPEVAATVWSNLVGLGGLGAGDTVLVHGGGSGIGTMAIQVARLVGARVVVTAGSARKLEACAALGADVLVDYRLESFVERTLEATGGRGVDVVLDIVGAEYARANVEVLAPGGRLVVIGIQSGAEATFDLREVLRRRAVVTGSMLRSRSLEDKAAIVADVVRHVLPAVQDGRVRPVVDRVLPLAEAAQAHALVESSDHVGKILLMTRRRD